MLVPTTTQGFPRVHATQSHLAPESPHASLRSPSVTTPLRWTRVPTGRDNGTGRLHYRHRRLPDSCRGHPAAVGHRRAQQHAARFQRPFRGLKVSGIGREGLLPYLQSETVLLEAARFPLSLRDGFVAADRLDLAGRVELIAQPLSGQTTRQFQCDHARSAVARAASVARSPRPSSAGVLREARAADPSWRLARIDTGCPSDVAPGLSSRPSTRRSGEHVRPRRQPSSHFATRGHNVDHAQLDSGNRLEGTQGG